MQLFSRLVNFIYIGFCGYFYAIKYRITHLFKRKTGLQQPQRKLPLIVSLTSYPPRFEQVFLSIESLLNQNLRPDKIILWLAAEEVAQKPLPHSVTKLKSRGLEIRIVQENIKSYKKIIYTLEQFSPCLIVTCDDDLMYPAWFLKDLYQTYQQHPDCICAYRGWIMNWKNNSQNAKNAKKLPPYKQWDRADNKNKTPTDELFPTTGGGVLYPPNTLHKNTTDRIFMQLCPYADDIWLKAMSLLNHTKVVMVKSKSIDFSSIENPKTQTLWQINQHKNDEQLAKVFSYFKLEH